MPNIRNDSAKVQEAHRQADIIRERIVAGNGETVQNIIANALLDIWQKDYKGKTMTFLQYQEKYPTPKEGIAI